MHDKENKTILNIGKEKRYEKQKKNSKLKNFSNVHYYYIICNLYADTSKSDRTDSK